MKISAGLFALALLAAPVRAEVAWVNLDGPTGERHSALLALPAGSAQHAGLVFHHDTNLRKQGYRRGLEHGFDLKQFATALARAGFVALAPLRRHGRFKADAAYVTHSALTDGPPLEFRTAVEEGVRVHDTALRHLARHARVDRRRLGVIGLGEGALIALWAAGDKRLGATLIFSPARLRKARHLNLKMASDEARLDHLRAPLFLAMGADGRRAARKIATRRLVSGLRKHKKIFTARLDYAGGREIFDLPRGAYWADAVSFLKLHLGDG